MAKPPTGDDWISEIKFDGYRILARIEAGKAKILTRGGHDWTAKFPDLEADLKKLKCKTAYLDGELCALDTQGRSDFSALQGAIHARRSDLLVYYVFDLLFLDGEDLRSKKLVDRRARLSKLVGLKGAKSWPRVRFSEAIEAEPELFFLHACRMKLEGIICKRPESPYRSGRQKSWVKVKCLPREEFVVGGYTQEPGGRIGALLLGHFNGKKLIYDGRVGTGFPVSTSRNLLQLLRPLHRSESPFAPDKKASKRTAQWVSPEIVCEVKYTARTAENYLRQASFVGIREDKPARKVRGDVTAKVNRGIGINRTREKY